MGREYIMNSIYDSTDRYCELCGRMLTVYEVMEFSSICECCKEDYDRICYEMDLDEEVPSDS